MNNVGLVKKFYMLFGKRDKAFLELCHDSIEWKVMENMPNGGTHIGKKDVFDGYFPKLFANYAEFHVEIDEHRKRQSRNCSWHLHNIIKVWQRI